MTGAAARRPRLATKRVYEPASRADGARLLVMRLWPRGIRRSRVDAWLRDLGPTLPLLRAYRGGRIGWAEYRRRYRAELRSRPEARAGLAEVRRRLRRGRVTLLCGCPDEARCHRGLLKTHLLDSTV